MLMPRLPPGAAVGRSSDGSLSGVFSLLRSGAADLGYQGPPMPIPSATDGGGGGPAMPLMNAQPLPPNTDGFKNMDGCDGPPSAEPRGEVSVDAIVVFPARVGSC